MQNKSQFNSEHQMAAKVDEINILTPECCVIYKITGQFFNLELYLVTNYAQKSKCKLDINGL